MLWQTPANPTTSPVSAGRTIYTPGNSSTGLVSFDTSNAALTAPTSSLLGTPSTFNSCLQVSSSNSNWKTLTLDNLINYVRGVDITGCRNRTVGLCSNGTPCSTSADCLSGGCTTNVWKMGDIVYSTPKVQADYKYCSNGTSFNSHGVHSELRLHQRLIYFVPEDGKRRLCRRKRRDAARFPNRNSDQQCKESNRIDGDSDLDDGQRIVGLHSPKQSSIPEVSCSSTTQHLPSLLQRFEPIHNDNGFERSVKDGPHRRDETRRRGHCQRNLLFQQCRGVQRTGMHTDFELHNVPIHCKLFHKLLYQCSVGHMFAVAESPDHVELHHHVVLQSRHLLQSHQLPGLSSYYALDITDAQNPKLLWEFSHPFLGYTYSGPAVIHKWSDPSTLTGDQYYVMFLSGPTNPTDGSSIQDVQAFVLSLNANLTINSVYYKDLGIKNGFGGDFSPKVSM